MVELKSTLGICFLFPQHQAVLAFPDVSSRWGRGSRFPLPTLSLRQERRQGSGVRCPRCLPLPGPGTALGSRGLRGAFCTPSGGPLPFASSVQRGFPRSPRVGFLLLPLPRQRPARAWCAVGCSPSSSRRWFLHLTACEALTRSLPGPWGQRFPAPPSEVCSFCFV